MALKLIKKGVSIGKNQNFIRNNIRDIQCIFDILISVHRELKKTRVHEVCVYAERSFRFLKNEIDQDSKKVIWQTQELLKKLKKL